MPLASQNSARVSLLGGTHLALGDALRLLLHDGGHGSQEHYHSSDVVVRASVTRCFYQTPPNTISVT